MVANTKANLAILAAAANINREHAKRAAAEQNALKQIVGLAPPIRATKATAANTKVAAANTKANLAILAAAANINREHAKRVAAEQDSLKQLVGLAPTVRATKATASLAKKGGRKQRQTRRQRQSRQQRQNQ